jgi:hypothetical protein
MFVGLSLRFMDLLNMFCKSMRTKPTPNSTAERIRKKNVRERRFTLS